MKTQSSKNLFLLAALLLAVAVLASACSINGEVVIPDTINVDVTMTESQLEQDSLGSVGYPCNLLLDTITAVEIHDGYVRYYGVKRLFLAEVYGSFDVALRTENGLLRADVIAVDIPGVEVTDPVVQKVNRKMEAELTKMMIESHTGVYFEEVILQEGELTIHLRVDLEQAVNTSININIP
jgi:hypothetical protein